MHKILEINVQISKLEELKETVKCSLILAPNRDMSQLEQSFDIIPRHCE